MLIGPIGILALAAAVYGIQEPGFGLNDQTLVLMAGFMGAFALQIYVYEGGQKLISERYGWPSAIKVFPAGLAIAVVCVLATKIEGLSPGLVYGFVAAHAFTGPANLTIEQDGKRVFYPGLALLALGAGAWFLVGPLRDLANDSESLLATIPEAIAVGLFVSAVQSMFFQMIPIRFMDGHKILRWSKPAWLFMAVLTAFLFWHALLNADRDSIDAVGSTNTIAALVLVLICFLITSATYLFFRVRQNGREPAAA